MTSIQNVVILGAGTMGRGIGQVALMAGYNVTIVDINEEFVENGRAEINKDMKKLESKGLLDEGKTAADYMKEFKKSIDITTAVKDADLVIEAVIEKLNIKKEVCKKVMNNSPDYCIFASNTSTMSITDIGKKSGRSENVIGMHFFNPAPLMKLVEVIYSENSSDKSINIGIEFAKTLPCLRGKRYVAKVLKDRPGFIVNRINAPVQIYLNWVFDQAAERNITWEQIDADAGKIMPMGPCELTDYSGLDIMKHTCEYYEKTLSTDFKISKIVLDMIEKGNLGAKTGRGFFDWSKGRPKIDKSKKAGLFELNISMAIMLNEGCRILGEGVVSGYKIIDKANMAGMNVPGPFGIGKNDWEQSVKLLEDIAEKTEKSYLNPCTLLKNGEFLKMR